MAGDYNNKPSTPAASQKTFALFICGHLWLNILVSFKAGSFKQ